MHPSSDEDLMGRAGRGDQAAFGVLVERHRRKAMALATRVALNRSEAEEIVQEAFARCWVKAPVWRAQGADAGARFTTWFTRVVVNLAIDRRRKPVSLALGAAGHVPANDPSPLDAAQAHEVGARVRQAMAALPERQRAALALCHFDGLSNAEAGRILEVDVGAVESLLVRARRAMREALQDLKEDVR